MVRSFSSRVKVDLRSLATALESYALDNGSYPAEHIVADFPAGRRPINLDANSVKTQSTIEPGRGESLFGLTTPISYMTSLFEDPYSSRPYIYHTDGKGWILISAGPDRRYDIDPIADYDSSAHQPSPHLLQKTYDPTNGTDSRGDVYRIWNPEDREQLLRGRVTPVPNTPAATTPPK